MLTNTFDSEVQTTEESAYQVVEGLIVWQHPDRDALKLGDVVSLNLPKIKNKKIKKSKIKN